MTYRAPLFASVFLTTQVLASTGWADSSVRQFLASDAAGSVKNPVALDTTAKALEVCSALQKPLSDDPDFDVQFKSDQARYQQALGSVYTVSIPPGRFLLKGYQEGREVLPIRLERPLWALESQLVINVMTKEDAPVLGFHVSKEEADGIQKALLSKRLRLDIEFRPDAAVAELSVCFSVPKSEALSLHAQPLSFTLVDIETNSPWARVRTSAWERLRTWLDPGQASLRLDLSSVEGRVNEPAVRAHLKTLKGSVQQCFEPVMNSAQASGMVVWSLQLTNQGTVARATTVLEALDDDSVLPCLGKLMRKTTWPTPSGAILQVSMSVEREGEWNSGTL